MRKIKKKKNPATIQLLIEMLNFSLWLNIPIYTNNIMSKYGIFYTLPISGPAVSNACMTATARAALDLEM